jgi:hypothetical protein
LGLLVTRRLRHRRVHASATTAAATAASAAASAAIAAAATVLLLAGLRSVCVGLLHTHRLRERRGATTTAVGLLVTRWLPSTRTRVRRHWRHHCCHHHHHRRRGRHHRRGTAGCHRRVYASAATAAATAASAAAIAAATTAAVLLLVGLSFNFLLLQRTRMKEPFQLQRRCAPFWGSVVRCCCERINQLFELLLAMQHVSLPSCALSPHR